MVFIKVGLLGSDDEIFFKYDNFLFHGIAEANFEGGTNLFFDIIFGCTLKSGKVEDFGFGSTLIGILLSFFGEYGFGYFLVLKLDVIEGIETDKFGVKGFVGDIELFLEILGVEGLLSGKLFEDLILLFHGFVEDLIVW